MGQSAIQDIYALSPMQQGLLFHNLYDSKDSRHVEQMYFVVDGELELDIFEQAWQNVLARHTALRTAILWEDVNKPVQIVYKQAQMHIAHYDWLGWSQEIQQEQLAAYLQADQTRGFDITEAPLIRVSCIQLAPAKCQVIFSYHHLVLDGWSLPVVLGEVFICYDALRQEKPLHLGPVRQYKDYIGWLLKQDQQQAESFWRKTLQGFTTPTQISSQHITDTPQQWTRENQEVLLSEQTTQALQALARDQQLTLNTICQGAWALLLSRYSGQDDIIFGAVVSGRPTDLSGAESIVGLFINTLPVRVRLNSEDSVVNWLKSIQTQQIELSQYEYSSLLDVHSWSEVPRGSSLFNSLFVFENYLVNYSASDVQGYLNIHDTQAISQMYYPLMILVTPGSQLRLELVYDSNSFEHTFIAQLAGHLSTLLEDMVTHLTDPLANLSMLTPAERELLLEQWHSSQQVSHPLATVPALFAQQVSLTPQAIALVCGEQHMSYAFLDERATLLARLLLDLGIIPEACVALCLERSLHQILALLAVLKVGAVYVPLDPALPSERLSWLVQDAQARLLLTHSSLLPRFPESTLPSLCLDRLPDLHQQGPAPCLPLPPIAASQLAYLMYTSGSTGTPKGIGIPHQAIVRLVLHNGFLPLDASHTLLHLAPLSFDASTLEIWGALLLGARLVLFEPSLPTFQELTHLLHEQAITTLWLTAGLFHHLVQEHPEALSGVPRVLAGGDVLNVESVRRVLREAPGHLLINGYGPTENTTFTCCYPMEHEHQVGQSVPIGRPIGNTSVYVLNEARQPVPIGVIGELYTGGEGLARGYWQQPGWTAERFVPHPFSTRAGERLYRTGDLVRFRADGQLEFVGRADQQVKLRGYRIELGEIESQLLAHPQVREAVVLVRQDHTTDSKQLVAYVVARHPQEYQWNQVHAFLQQRLPDYMVPNQQVELTALPLTPNGKIDRHALPAPDASILPAEQSYVPAHTDLETQLVHLWQQVLGQEHIGIQDNFFALGGDSIQSIRIVARATQAGIPLVPRHLFEYQTIAELAQGIQTTNSTTELQTEQGMVSGEVPLTPIQHWFFEQEQPEPHHWNQAIILTLQRPLDQNILQLALQQILLHHDALRLRFTQTEQGWQQINAAAEAVAPLQFCDLSRMAKQEQQTRLEAITAEQHSSLHLEEGPLLRMVYFDMGTENHARLLIIVHHLIVDGVSWRLLLEDLQTVYDQIAKNRAVQLPPKTTSFRQWAQRLQNYAQQEEIAAQLPHWQAVTMHSATSLPVDNDSGENTVASERTVVVSLSQAETNALLYETSSAYRTQINDLLLTALVQTLRQWTGESSHIIHMEGHGREDLFPDMDLSRTIGWFTSLYPVKLQLDTEMETGAALKAIKEQLRTIPGHGIGYGILRYLRQDDEQGEILNGQPQAELSFNYLGQFAQDGNEAGVFSGMQPANGPARSILGRRQYLLEIVGIIAAGQLHLNWIFSANRHQEQTIQQLANRYRQVLQTLIAHCQSPQARGYTPSDFPLAQLTQAQIDTLMMQHPDLEALYPLSHLQQGLLFQSLYAPGEGNYIVQIGLRMQGTLTIEAFMSAWQQAIQRHTILRTAFLWEGLEEPLQLVHRRVHIPCEILDWRAYSPQEQVQQLQNYRQELRLRGFELTRAPLMQLSLLQLSDDRYEFLWTHHHLLLDGWSLSIVLKEVMDNYDALVQGRALPWEPVAPYQNYISWLVRQDLVQAETFWRHYLQGFSTPTPLSIGPVPATTTQLTGPQRGEQLIQLTDETTQALHNLAREQHLTLNTILLGAWGWMLSCYSGQDDVVTGIIIAGRPAEVTGIESMIGLFINTLPVRIRLAPHQSLLTWLYELQKQQSEVRQYEYSPLVQVQNWSDVPNDVPLFESLFVLENYPLASGEQRVGDVRLQITSAHALEQTHYPLTFVVFPDRHLSLKLMYDRTRFEDEAMARLLDHMQALLENMLTNHEQPSGQVTALSFKERQCLLETWNTTQVPYPKEACVHHLFEERVRCFPDAIALAFGEQQMSYKELNIRANQLAHYLRRQGVKSEVCVGICMHRSVVFVICLLGILKAGGTYVSIDPGYPQERQAFMLHDAQIKILLAQQGLADDFEDSAVQVLYLDASWDKLAREEQSNLASAADARNLAYVNYTSGSTGTPKGVSVTHQAIVRLVMNTNYIQLDASDSVAHASNIAFDAATFEIWGALLNGARLVGIDRQIMLSPLELAEQLREQRISTLFLTTALFNQVARSSPDAFAEVKHLLFGGEAVDPLWAKAVHEQGKPERLLHVYGPTETTTFATWYEIPAISERARTIPIGHALSNTTLYILDQRLNPVPVGAQGELYIGGDGLARGYLHRADLTAERFIAHPYSQQPGARLYRTGDLVRALQDGALEYVGRVDQQVKIRGYRIELGEIESRLFAHPHVREAVVLVRQDSAGANQLVAYLVPENPEEFQWSQVQAALRQRLPEYMIPILHVEMDALPLTPNGKLNRSLLLATDLLATSSQARYLAPQTEVQRHLVTIWEHVLGVKDVGILDNFFALGGHSLLATQTISHINTQFHLEIRLVRLFETPTIQALAQHIEEVRQAKPHEPLLVLGSISREQYRVKLPRLSLAGNAAEMLEEELVAFPTSFAQQRLWFLDQLEPETASYNLTSALGLRGSLHFFALARSIAMLVQRHEALRTTFSLVDGQPVQVITPPQHASASLTLIDLSHLSASTQEPELHRLLSQEAHHLFSLAQGPLLRTSLVRLHAHEHVLLLNMHHIISDGWSMSVFAYECTTLYTAFATATLPDLAPLSLHYVDYALWQREWLQGAIRERQISYWQEQLAGAPAFLHLPLDHPRPPLLTFHGASQTFTVPAPVVQELKALGQQEDATLFMVLLAVFQLLLARYSGQDEILVGTPIANRTRQELEPLIGFFVNTLVLRTDLGGHPSFRTLLHRVRQVALGAYAHQDLPFEQVVDALQPERDLSRNPLFQVMLALQNTPMPSQSFAGLHLHPIEIERDTAKFELFLSFVETEQGLSGLLEYNTDLFAASSMSRLLTHFQRLLSALLAAPDAPVARISLLTAGEEHTLLYAYNPEVQATPQHQRLQQHFETQALLHPERIALVHEEQHLSYGELDRRATHLAQTLHALGVQPEEAVGLCLQRRVEVLIGLLAILKVGGAYLPLDPASPQERLHFQLRDAQVRILLTQQSLQAHFQEAVPTCLSLDEHVTWNSESSQEPLTPASQSQQLAYVIYTSGSTGTPKGVGITHRSALTLLHWAQQTFAPAILHRVLASTSLCFDLSLFELFVPWSIGGTVILVEHALTLPQQAAQQAITLLNTVPSAISELLRQAQIPTSVQAITLAGEPLPPPLVSRLYALSHVTAVYNLYGPTEATTYSTWALLEREAHSSVPIGRPVLNTQVYVLDPHLQLVPPGVVGELYLAGDGLARGYLHRPDLTAERFIAHPYSQQPGARLYRTGDLVRWHHDGQLEYLGRSDQQVKLRGYRIELGEIESRLFAHPHVREAVVLVRQDSAGANQLVAYLVPENPEEFQWSQVQAALRQRLPEYMIPILHVEMDALPLTPNGKLNRSLLLATDLLATSSQARYLAPQTEVQRHLVTIWEHVLGVKDVGILDNFFALGGHSLLATQTISHINTQFHLEIRLVRLFETPTIQALAQHIEEVLQTKPHEPLLALGSISRERHRVKLPRLSQRTNNSDNRK